jgi:hypothetical protein
MYQINMSHRSYPHRTFNKTHSSHNHNDRSNNNIDRSNKIMDTLNDLKDYMFDCKNLRQFTKHNMDFVSLNDTKSINKVEHIKNSTSIDFTKFTKDSKIDFKKETELQNNSNSIINKDKDKNKNKDNLYKPKQRDSLFWCFFILKYGFSKYEMEVGNQHFPIEKQEKFKYIDLLRKQDTKELIKMHKIKPLSLLEDDLANQERISIKTFFALCIVENINIILIDKRKLYEIITTDDPKIHIIHKNSITYEHHIEMDILPEKMSMYRETYYKMPNFDASLKSMTSYKVDELLELCKKLDINVENNELHSKKRSKKDIYELLVQQF